MITPFIFYLAMGVTAFAVSFASLPFWRVACERVGLVDDPGARKIHSATIPLAGGFAVLAGILAPFLVAGAVWLLPGATGAALREAILTHGLHPGRRAGELGVILLGGLGMLTIGALDDKYELPPRWKFAGQLAIALLVASAKVRITLFVPSVAFSYAITCLWILSVINAFNFMDNMNGLCAGLGAIGAAYFAVLAAAQGQYLVAVLGAGTMGALLGFLPHNFPRASAFLGDAGSHLVGYLLAIMAILPHYYTAKNPHPWAVLIPLLILAVPLGDMAWVVVIRWRLGQPFYVGDNNHLSHRLVRSGWSRPAAVMLVWALALGIGAISLLDLCLGAAPPGK